jgi:hypothetical protein
VGARSFDIAWLKSPFHGVLNPLGFEMNEKL